MKVQKNFFKEKAEIVAQNLLGKILCRRIGNKILKSRILETEAYLGEKDPASWARFGKRKDNLMMWESGGITLIKNVHKHLMLNFVTGKKDEPQAVLIRALEPLNFEGRCKGPGLLTNCLKIDKNFNGKSIFDNKEIWLEEDNLKFKIFKSYRIGVKKDLKKKMRFYIKGNGFVEGR